MDIRIQKSIDFIERNINEDLKVEQLARDVSLSPKYFQKLFKAFTNYTPTKYIEKSKISKCKELLETTNLQVLDISAQMGYLNYETFSRTFKRYYAIAPNDYKKILKSIGFTTKNNKKVVLKVSNCENRYPTIEEIKIDLKLAKDSKIFVVTRVLLVKELNDISVRNKFHINECYV